MGSISFCRECYLDLWVEGFVLKMIEGDLFRTIQDISKATKQLVAISRNSTVRRLFRQTTMSLVWSSLEIFMEHHNSKGFKQLVTAVTRLHNWIFPSNMDLFQYFCQGRSYDKYNNITLSGCCSFSSC